MPSPLERLREGFAGLGPGGKAGVAAGAVAVIVALALGVGAVVGGGTTPTTTTTTTTTTAPLPPAPLTGVPVDDLAALSRPAISVKIGNNTEARPQSGLDVADIVYEEEVEGRITRFLAVFHSKASSPVGPVRSVRLMDPFIARPLGGVFVYSGGANVPERITRLNEAGLRHFDEGGLEGVGARIMDSSHGNGRRPNILFANLERLWEANEGSAPPPAMFAFLQRGQAFDGEVVTEVVVPVGTGGFRPTWRWDAAEGLWRRFYGDEPFEAKSGNQVTAANLVIQFVERTGEESLVIGEGEAAILSDGKIVRGRWQHLDPSTPTRYFDAQGAEILLTPGRTWVHLPLAGGEIVTR